MKLKKTRANKESQELHNAYFYKKINDLIADMDDIKKSARNGKIIKLLLVLTAILLSYLGLNSEWLGFLEVFS